VQSVSIEAWFLHGRVALACAFATRKQRAERIATARRCAQLLASVPVAWRQAFAAQLTAGAAHAEGDLETAVAGYTDAEVRYRGADMRAFERATRLARGELIAGGGGAALREDAIEWMREQSIEDPGAFSRVLVPR
jgi:hypothetical protein